MEYELSEHGSFSDPRRFSVGLLQEVGYLDENLQRCVRQKPSSPTQVMDDVARLGTPVMK